MRKLKKSKGFTLTELAIVIAVIAILIAVLVPTFISLINKANESSDSQLVKNLNTVLSVNEATDGEAATMSDALAVAAENGYNVDKLTPSSSGDIVWDQVSNRFLLIGEDGSIVYKDSSTSDSVTSTIYQLWYIASSSDDVDYSVYYTSGYSGTVTSTVTNKGIDVSALSEAVDITYQSSDSTSQSVIINGNGGSLTVNDSNQLDDIDVYNVSSTINGESVADSSLHLHGEVTGNIYMTKGHIEVEDTAVLGVPYVIALSEDVSVSSATVAVKVVSGSSSVSVANITVSGNVDNSDTSTYDTTTLKLFAGGFGTEESPYQISTAEQFTNISSFSDNMNNGSNAYYFCLVNDIDASDISASWVSYYFCGTFDGNNYTISNLTLSNTSGTYCAMFANTYGDTIIKDLTLNSISVTADISSYSVKAGGIVSQVSSGTTLLVSNVTVNGAVTGKSSSSSSTTYAGGLVGCVNGAATVSFVDCTNNAAISSEETYTNRSAYAGGIVGYLKVVTAQFDNCNNTGTIYSTSEGSMGGIVGYVCDGSSAGSLTVSGCSNSGLLSGSSASGGLVGNVHFTTYACEVEITDSYNTGSIMGSKYAGGILSQANVSTIIISVKILNCVNSGAVTGGVQAGGIAASCSKATFTIENCSNSATITGGTDAVGGLIGVCGTSNGSITNCSNSGNVICTSTSGGGYYGGIVGNLSHCGTVSISNCSNTKNVGYGSDGSSHAKYVGGIIGQILDGSSNAATVTLSSCTVSNCTIYSVDSSYLSYFYGYFSNNNNNSTCTVDESCSYTNVNLITSSSSDS